MIGKRAKILAQAEQTNLAVQSNQGHELTLNVSVAINIPLGGQQGPVTCEQLHIAE